MPEGWASGADSGFGTALLIDTKELLIQCPSLWTSAGISLNVTLWETGRIAGSKRFWCVCH